MPKEKGTYSRGMSSTRSRGSTASYTADEGRENEEGSESDDDFEDDESGSKSYADELYQPEFEDCLDGSSKKDKIYENEKIWNEVPYGSIRLEP